MYSPLVEKALGIALAAHDGQLRKASTEPYIVHPLHVALILARWGQEDDVIVSGLLHDVVEDCDGWDLARVEREFGRHIAHVVGELTEDKSKSWEERKDGSVRVQQVIIVGRDGHKAMVLGKGGALIKEIGRQARVELTEMLERPVHLFLFVKVDERWQEKRENYSGFGLEFDV